MAGNKGRRKIPMTRIANKNNRLVTFSKRRNGLFRKASEISTLCGAEVAMVVFSPGDKVYSFGHPSVQSTINKYMGRNNHPDNVLPIIEVQGRVRIHQLNQQLAERKSQLEAERDVGKELDEMRKVAKETQELWEVPEGRLNREQRKQLQLMLEKLQKDVAEQKMKIKESSEAGKSVVSQTASSSAGGANGGDFGGSIIPQGLPLGSGIGLRNSSVGSFNHDLGNALDNSGISVSAASSSSVECSMTPHGLSLGNGIGVGHLNTYSSIGVGHVSPISSFGVGHIGPSSSSGEGHVGPSSSFGVGHMVPTSSFGVGHIDPSSSFGVGYVGPSSSLGVGHPSPSASFGVGHLSPSAFGVSHPSPSSVGVGHIGTSWSHDVGNMGRSAISPSPNNVAQILAPLGYSQGGGSGTYLRASSLSNVWQVGQSTTFGLGTRSAVGGYSGNTGARGLQTSTTSNGYALGEGIGVSHLSSSSSFDLGHHSPSSSFGVGHVGPLSSNDVEHVGLNATAETNGVHFMNPLGYSQGGGGTVPGGSSLPSIWAAGQFSSLGLENSISVVDYTSNYGTSMLLQEYTQSNVGPSALGTVLGGPSLPSIWPAGQSSSFGLENRLSAVDYTSNYGTSTMLLQENTQDNVGPSTLTATNAAHSMPPHGYAQGYGGGVGASSTSSLFGNVGQDDFSFVENEFGWFGMSMMFNDFGVNDVGATATISTGVVRSVMPHGSSVGGDGGGVGTVGSSSLSGVGQVGLPPSSGWTNGAAYGQSMMPPSGNGQGFWF